jgi:MerR family transcriptional regulator/heat shock protein HspR
MSDQFYTIGEAADVLGVSIPTLRLYEREGLIISYRRESKHRRYSETDIERIRCMRIMIKKEKVSVEGIKRLLAMIPCWKIKECPDNVRTACPAFLQNEKPCWMASGKSWKCKSDECHECIVYTSITNCQMLKQTIAEQTLIP